MTTIRTILYGVLAVILALTFTTCEEPHTHEWGAWQSNAEQHWKECSCGEKTYIGNHDYDTDFVCTVCGYYILQNWTAVSDSKFPATYTSNNYTFLINAIAYGNNRFVAGGNNGRMAYSANGESWTAVSNSTFGSDDIRCIAYGSDGNRFVAGGSGGKMAYSTDGTSWTAVSGSGLSADAIAYGNNRFVAGNGNGKMAYSDDGVSWTAVSNSTFGTSIIYGITYGIADGASVGKFVAVGGSGKMAYSADGVSWTAVSNIGTYINAIAYGNGRFVAVGSSGKMAYSSDGESWTAISDSTFGTDWIYAITYDGNGRFVAVGGSGKIAYADWTGE